MEGTQSHGHTKERFVTAPVICNSQANNDSPAATNTEESSPFEHAVAVLASSASRWCERLDAVNSLAETQNPAAVTILGELLRMEPERRVRGAAVSTLVRLQYREGLRFLAYVAKRDPEPSLVRKALDGIGELLQSNRIDDKFDDADVLELLGNFSRLHRDKNVRAAAQNALQALNS